MNRRDLIKNVVLIIGGTLSAPTLKAMDFWADKQRSSKGLSDFKLDPIQQSILAEVAEMILPKTTTPGAKDAGVPAFIEMMIKDCYYEPEQMSFKEGLADLKDLNFMKLAAAERVGVLKYMEQDTKKEMQRRQVKQTKMGDNIDEEQIKAAQKGLPFWRLVKELTLLGYYTSEIGVNASFEYNPIPGKLELIKVDNNQKAFAY